MSRDLQRVLENPSDLPVHLVLSLPDLRLILRDPEVPSLPLSRKVQKVPPVRDYQSHRESRELQHCQDFLLVQPLREIHRVLPVLEHHWTQGSLESPEVLWLPPGQSRRSVLVNQSLQVLQLVHWVRKDPSHRLVRWVLPLQILQLGPVIRKLLVFQQLQMVPPARRNHWDPMDRGRPSLQPHPQVR